MNLATVSTLSTATADHIPRFTWTDSPLGRILLSGDERGLSSVQLETESRGVAPGEGAIEDAGMFRDAVEQLRAYFAGELQRFILKLNPVGTPFQQRAWAELRRIPYGQTITYGEQARRMGDAKASRAVGRANGANPIGIIIPCHRVIGGNGQLTGFGAGLTVKAWLLNHEAGLFGRA